MLAIEANKINRIEKPHFYLILMLLMVSGNPFFGFIFGWELILMVVSCCLGWLLIRNNRLLLENRGLLIFSIFSIIFTYQIIYYSSFPVVTIVGFFLRLFIGYATIRLVVNFTRLYIVSLYRLCIMSLILWGLGRTGLVNNIILMFPEIHRYEWSEISTYSIGFHSFFVSPELGVLRNAGLFWEPGAFAGYIIVAIIFLSLGRQSYTEKSYKRCLTIFIITLLTTMSSAGYMLLPLSLLLGYNFKGRKGTYGFKPLIILLLIPLGSSIAFNNIEFLKYKTSSQLEKTLTMSDHDIAYNNTRFGTLMFDWFYIKSSPIFGNGLHESTRYRYHGNDRVDGQGNGLSDFVAKFGFLGFSCFAYFLYAGLIHCFGRSKKVFLSMFIMFASLNAEPFLNYPLYLGFIFLICTSQQNNIYE